MAAGWYQDPAGRFASRYFDGVAWSSWVTDSFGRAGQDPSPVGGGAPGPPAPVPSWGPQPIAAPPAAVTAPGPVASWVPVVLGVGVLLLLAGLVALPWIDGDHGGFGDVRQALIDADEADAEVDGGLLFYFAWGMWAIVIVSTITALGAAFGRRKMSRVARIAFVATTSLIPAAVFFLATAVATTSVTQDGQADGGTGAGTEIVVAAVVALFLAGLAMGLSYVPAHIATALLAGIGVLLHVHAMTELSDGGADLGLGAVVSWVGYVALSIAAIAGRRQRWRT